MGLCSDSKSGFSETKSTDSDPWESLKCLLGYITFDQYIHEIADCRKPLNERFPSSHKDCSGGSIILLDPFKCSACPHSVSSTQSTLSYTSCLIWGSRLTTRDGSVISTDWRTLSLHTRMHHISHSIKLHFILLIHSVFLNDNSHCLHLNWVKAALPCIAEIFCSCENQLALNLKMEKNLTWYLTRSGVFKGTILASFTCFRDKRKQSCFSGTERTIRIRIWFQRFWAKKLGMGGWFSWKVGFVNLYEILDDPYQWLVSFIEFDGLMEFADTVMQGFHIREILMFILHVLRTNQ